MSTTERFAHTLGLLDHPSDPMVILFELGFTPAFRARGFTAGDLRQATLRLFERHEKLRFALHIEVAAFRGAVAPAEHAAVLNARAWSQDGLPLDDFRRISIPFEQAPLLRFKFDPEEGLMVACHHSLMDGFGCYELVLELFRELHPTGILETTALTRPVPSPRLGERLLRRWVGIVDELRRGAEISRHPTTLLGPAAPAPAQRHGFATADLALAEVKRTCAALGGVTVNDAIVSAFHLVLDDVAATRQAPDRLSVLVPVNMRPRHAGNPRFVNRMGYVSVSTLPEHRRTGAHAAARVRAQMARAKRFGTEDTVERIMGLYEALGIMKRVRKDWLATRTPSRFRRPDKLFWKNFDTAAATNMGRLHAPEPYASWVARAHAFAPVTTPSISLAVVGVGDRVSFGLRFGESVLSEAKGRALLLALVGRLATPDLAKHTTPLLAA